jgi:hypothetical protein
MEYTYSEIQKINNGILTEEQLNTLITLIKSQTDYNIEISNSQSHLIVYFDKVSFDMAIDVRFYSTIIIVGIFTTGMDNKWVFKYDDNVETIKETINTLTILYDNYKLGKYRHSY